MAHEKAVPRLVAGTAILELAVAQGKVSMALVALWVAAVVVAASDVSSSLLLLLLLADSMAF
jgi:hypothetical protein